MALSGGSSARPGPEATRPLVTVFVACYNHARFVIEALESVRIQAYPRVQLIVADDCSKDDSVAVIRRWLRAHWPDALLLAHERNVGVCATFNEILRHARGKYVAGFSADDVWLPGRLEAQVAWMEAQPDDVGVLYSDAYQMDEFGRPLPEMFIAHHRRGVPPEGWIFEALIEQNFIPAMTTLIRRRCFEVVGNYDETLAYEDWDMWLRIARRFRFGYWPQATAKYRILPTSLMRSQLPAVQRSCDRVLIKCLWLGWLQGPIRWRALHLAYRDAMDAYRLGSPDGLHAAWKLCRARPIWRHLLLLGCCRLKLPVRWHDALLRAANRLRRRPVPA